MQSDLPYTDYTELITLQALNSANLGRVLHSIVTCAGIVDHISFQMRSSVIASMVAANSPFSVLL